MAVSSPRPVTTVGSARIRSAEDGHPLLGHLPARDRRLFRRFGWGPDRPAPDLRIHQAVEHWAAVVPDAVAAEHRGVRLTYRDLNRQADRLAARLVAEGVRAGSAVGVFAERSLPMVVAILATLKAGAAYVPQDPRIAPPELLRAVADTAACPVLLTTTAMLDRMPAGHTAIAVDQMPAAPAGAAAPPRPMVGADDPCYVIFTSGTTGRPNGVRVTHRNVANVLLTRPGDLGIRPGVRVAQLLNVAFDMAAWEILGCLANGGTLVLRERDLTATAGRCDVVIATPSVLARIDPDRCGRVGVVAVAGEPCPRPLADRWAAGRAFWNCCGPTETTIVNTMHRHRPGGPLTIGPPGPNNTVYVLDAAGRPCRIGEVGEMWAGGDCVTAGYLGNPALTAERYAADPFLGGGRLMFRTRDLGRWTADGELEHLGRGDDQVKVRGFRVELGSVSAALESMPGCRRAAALKVDDRDLVAFVTPAGLDPRRCRDAVAERLPYYCVPARVYAMDELPMTSRGKVDRAALLRLAGHADAFVAEAA